MASGQVGQARRSAAGFASATLVFALAGCGPVDPPAPGVVPTTSVSPPQPGMQALIAAKCDTDEFEVASRPFVERRIMRTLVSAENLHVADVHDCQRLLDRAAVSTGSLERAPLVGIFVPRQDQMADLDDLARGVVIADLLNHDDFGYSPLGIEKGLNCLWLRAPQHDHPEWRAAIFVPEGEACVGQVPKSTAISLQVSRLQIGEGELVYPATARWMWDRENREQFIGTRCGDGWCEIGRPGFHSSTHITDSRSVPGWGDEQLLSYMQPPTPWRRVRALFAYGPPPMPLRASTLLGRVEPTDSLREHARRYQTPPPAAALYFQDSIPVARITFEGADPAALAAYHRKYGFVRLPQPGSSHNMLYLRASNCDDRGSCAWESRTAPGRWRALQRSAHHLHVPSGSVRWAWNEQDEDVWSWCDGACCKTKGCQIGESC
jgi:hypothetical protein